jgi:hypothetical protein
MSEQKKKEFGLIRASLLFLKIEIFSLGSNSMFLMYKLNFMVFLFFLFFPTCSKSVVLIVT